MRKIKFKAERQDTRKCVKGFYICLNTDNKGGKLHIIVDDCGEYHKVKPETLCEFTGLYDDNKKEIYEKDIVHCVDKINDIEFWAVVEFGNPNGLDSWGWQLNVLKGDEDANPDILLWIETEMEETTAAVVVGDIFNDCFLICNCNKGVEK